MRTLTVKQYEKQSKKCEGLCVPDSKLISPNDPTKLPCVTCPFCKQIVTAELTPTTIHCPKCKVTVKR